MWLSVVWNTGTVTHDVMSLKTNLNIAKHEILKYNSHSFKSPFVTIFFCGYVTNTALNFPFSDGGICEHRHLS